MKITLPGCALFLLLAAASGCATGGSGEAKTFGDASFIAYQGTQRWPTGEAAQVIKDFAVPIYIGLPPRKYTVLGRIYDPRTRGVGIVGRAFAEGLFSERDRQRDVADQARYRGADAVVATSHVDIIRAFGLSRDEVDKSAPLFEHKDKIVVAVKFVE